MPPRRPRRRGRTSPRRLVEKRCENPPVERPRRPAHKTDSGPNAVPQVLACRRAELRRVFHHGGERIRSGTRVFPAGAPCAASRPRPATRSSEKTASCGPPKTRKGARETFSDGLRRSDGLLGSTGQRHTDSGSTRAIPPDSSTARKGAAWIVGDASAVCSTVPVRANLSDAMAGRTGPRQSVPRPGGHYPELWSRPGADRKTGKTPMEKWWAGTGPPVQTP